MPQLAAWNTYEVAVPPTDMPWARLAVLRDPQGAAFTISQLQPPA